MTPEVQACLDGALTADQLAERFKVARTTVMQWGRTGRGPRFFTVQARRYYFLEDVEAFEDSCLLRPDTSEA